MLLCGLVAKQNLNQILKGVPKSLARWSDLGTLGSFLVPMYGGSFQVSAGGVVVAVVSLLKRNGAVSGAANIVGLAVGLARESQPCSENGTACRLPCGSVAKQA